MAFRREYAFADIDEFVVQYVGRGGRVIVFRLAQDSPRRTKLAVIDEALSGFDGSMGGSWEMALDDLVDLLNRTRLLPSAWK